MVLVPRLPGWAGAVVTRLIYGFLQRTVLLWNAVVYREPTCVYDRTHFWHAEVVRVLRRMLELSNYPPEMRDHYIRVYDGSIIPHLGPIPDEFGTVYKPCSIMVDDNGPAELGWAVDSLEKMIVRFYAEPLVSTVNGSPASRDTWMPILDNFVHAGGQPDPDLGWVQICIDALTCEPLPAFGGSIGTQTSQFILGADLDKTGMTGKAYFWPTLRSRMSGTSNIQTINACMERLGLVSQWSTVTSYLATLPASHSATPEVVAVSTVRPEHNGIKAYIRTCANTLADLIPYMTLGGNPTLVNHDGVRSAVDSVRLLWRLLFNVDEHTAVHLHRPNFWASGILVYYDLAPGRAYPLPKLFIDVRHRCQTDVQIARAVKLYFEETGNDGIASWYEAELSSMFCHRELAQRTGVHTWVGVGVKKSGPRITLYYSPEVFSPRSQSIARIAVQKDKQG
ncbi:aromatic prenyltransferase [Punctularia strigosozonata HHB-11173 SS5]|uniref:aromatic prenyltransferase n=1 Tax=Punctularia strigosozonata (strain HHB-11173) TaxID=741275 RepID=UPI00044176FD|nr:aromatic prenyltransferase [Punctularia strigosozonata HHB-11173 SS5]EIN06467.1 aromatic prenyltransferase [Punctularia strigosozonata HHB-11173 SS5]